MTVTIAELVGMLVFDGVENRKSLIETKRLESPVVWRRELPQKVSVLNFARGLRSEV